MTKIASFEIKEEYIHNNKMLKAWLKSTENNCVA